jgi:hypothetical protein
MTSANKSLGRRAAWRQATLAGLLALAASPSMAASVTLCAEPYQQALPAVGNVWMWGYRQATDSAACATGAGVGISSPGPLITVPAADTTLQVTLVNNLTVPTSIVLAGQAMPLDASTPMAPVHALDLVGGACSPAADPQNCRVRSFTGETAPGASRTYTFANLRPGTYLYQSGTHPQVQIQMGLFGMARHDAGTAGQLFAGTGAAYDADVPVVVSEIDPDQHALIAATLGGADPTAWKSGNNSTLKYAPRFFLVNGRVFAGVDGAGHAATDLPVSTIPGSRIVLRLANAGLMSRSLVLNSGTWKLLTEDGNAYPAPREQASVLLPAGKTSDALLISAAPTNGTTNASVALFDRRGGTDNADGAGMGGQVARLVQSGPSGPFITPIPGQVANEGTTFALQVQGGGVASYALSNPPAGMTISNLPASFGAITWPVPLGTTLAAGYAVTVADTGGNASASFGLRVNHAPTIAQTGPIAVAHGTVTIAAPGVLAGATDPDAGDTLSAVQTAAPGAGVLALNAGGGYTWTGAQPATGSTTVTFAVAARDAYGLTSIPRTVTLNVAANVAPVASNGGSFSAPKATISRKGNALQQLSLAYQLTPPSPFDLGYASLVTATDADGTVSANTFTATVTKVNGITGAVLALAGGNEASAIVSADGATISFLPRTVTLLGVKSFNLVGNANTSASASLGVYRITYTVKDDQGLASNVATLFVRVQ